MRIEHRSPALLVVSHRPRLVPATMAALALIGVYVFCFERDRFVGGAEWWVPLGIAVCVAGVYLTSRGCEFRFDARIGALVWRRQEPFLTYGGRLDLSKVVHVETEPCNDSDRRAVRLVVLTDRGGIPMSYHFSTLEPLPEMAVEINAWLGRHRR